MARPRLEAELQASRSIRISDSLWNRAKAAAENDKLTMNQWIRKVLKERLGK